MPLKQALIHQRQQNDGALRPALLRADAIACRRGRRLLFQHLSFALQGGELLQVSGPNGCGKTTLLHILSGLRTPDHGRIGWRDHDRVDDSDAFRRELAVVGHRAGVNQHLTPAENLQAACALMGRACEPQQWLEALAVVGLRQHAFQPCRKLSSGQVRRTALARLLLSQATLWILDEPLAGLDSAGQSLVESLILRHIAAGGICVYTTHQPLTGLHHRARMLALNP